MRKEKVSLYDQAEGETKGLITVNGCKEEIFYNIIVIEGTIKKDMGNSI